MAHAYNDIQMMMATQVAYLDMGGNSNVGDVVDNILSMGTYNNGHWELKPEYSHGANSGYLKKQLEVAANIDQISRENPSIGESWRNWNVVDRCDDNNRSGFYGCLIDTGSGDAIIGCRGSESYDGKQFIKDWGIADFGLLNNALTAQQAKAEQYMQRLYYQYGDKYDSFSVTGHSLGGNLAQHMTITAPAGMREKLDHTISFDGPGFSEEYIRAHREQIEKAAPYMDHYQWSLISSLLYPLPGVKDKIIKAHDDPDHSIMGGFYRHDVHNIEFDENGSVQQGDESSLSKGAGPLSRIISEIGTNSTTDQILRFVLHRVPVLAPIAVCYDVIVGVKVVRAAFHKFQELAGRIKDTASNIFYNYIAPKVSGDYQVQTQALASIQSQLQTAYSALDNVTDELAQVYRNWSYWSGAGAYFRTRLFTEKTGLELDISRLKAMAKVLDKVANTYTSVDAKVADRFA